MNEISNDLFRLKIDTIMANALEKQTFSACSLGFFKNENGKKYRKIFNYGRTGLGIEKKPVCRKTIFDLASLTKPLVTSLVVLYLVNQGKINLEDKLSKYFKSIKSDKSPIKLKHLLLHTSGLPAHRSYYIELIKKPFDGRKKHMEESILSEKLCYVPGKKCLYSDLGFILLGFIIEKVTGEDIDIFWEKNILQPMKIKNEIFFKKIIKKDNSVYAETGICSWSKMKLKGLVNDDNCRALGGVAGHAGLFATSSGLLSYIEKILNEIKEKTNILKLNKEIIKTFYHKQKESSWVNGFDTPSSLNSSSGKLFSDLTLGHLGFTGTSFWMDLDLGCGVVLLTNRVLCGENLDSIRKFRPLVHNEVMKYIKDKKE
jgi:CubicO group peptidase (beta-lactamase class C family)